MPSKHVANGSIRQSETSRRLIPPAGHDIGLRREQARAELIADYWRAKGHLVSVKVVQVSVDHGTLIWGIKSSLGGPQVILSISRNPIQSKVGESVVMNE
jgi:hypothetical protein